jgi:hypothetical protein
MGLPHHVDALLGLADLEGNPEEARRLFQQAVEAGGLPEQRARALNRWAELELSAGNRERARQLYRQALDVK